ncbi:MAG: helix-turn-helix transcriptional regulator [Bacteroidales bacterium]|nr:helix-turn-helix transcriptional regulator [Bacteroidales bacterium]
MRYAVNELMTVEAELTVPSASTQVVRFHLPEPADHTMRSVESYRIDLCLTPRPRNTRACYPDHWAPNRYERLGELFVVPPGEAIRARSDDVCQQSSVVCFLSPATMDSWFDDDLTWTEGRLVASLDVRETNIRNLLLRLAEEAKHPGFASDVMVELIAAQLAIELGRYCRVASAGPTAGGLAAWRLRLIDERLREVRAAPTLAELAELCRLSVRQLTRGFRISRGCSIGEHVANTRMEHARGMLAADLSVKSIAYELGFSSPSSFCYAFRKATGETPVQFRHRQWRAA